MLKNAIVGEQFSPTMANQQIQEKEYLVMKKFLSLCLAIITLISYVCIVNASGTIASEETILNNKVYLDRQNGLIIVNAITVSSDVVVNHFREKGIETQVTDKNGKELESANLGTGVVVKAGDTVYKVVMKGDVDGSGVVDSTDYLRLKKVFLGDLPTPEGIYMYSADMDQNARIDATDYLQIKKVFLKTYEKEPDVNEPPVVPSELKGTYNINIWVPEKEGVDKLTQEQIKAFMAKNPGIVINATIEKIAEGDAVPKVLYDVENAPDIYCFTQDQLVRLVQANALATPDRSIRDNIIAINTDGSIKSASIDGELYAYPLTADNGYYMYYDKSIISEEDAKSLEKLIAACEANNRKFRFGLENGWYTASFFFATGCKSEWKMNEKGEFVSFDDDFNSAKGLIAMKGMQKLTKSIAYDSNNYIFEDAGVIITGIWDDEAARKHFGENYAVAELPSFTVDGKSYHLGSFSGYRLMGVKPQADPKREAVLSFLAQYLTGEDCQKERYQNFKYGPSNKTLLSEYVAKENPALAALAEQNKYSIPQGMIHGSWWDIAKNLGRDAKDVKNEDDFIGILSTYERSLKLLFNTPKDSWSVIGTIHGTSWNHDFSMTKISDTVWESDVFELRKGEEFKVREAYNWDVNFGETFNGKNIVVPEDGNYIVRLTWYGGENGTVELIKQ